MNRGDCRRFVYRSIADSLVKYADRLKTSDLGHNARQKDVTYTKQVMQDEAAKYRKKIERKAVATQGPAAPGPSEGADVIPQDDQVAG